MNILDGDQGNFSCIIKSRSLPTHRIRSNQATYFKIIGTDALGEPVHASQYRYLWSNGPKEALEFPEYTFEKHYGKAIPSFPPRQSLSLLN